MTGMELAEIEAQYTGPLAESGFGIYSAGAVAKDMHRLIKEIRRLWDVVQQIESQNSGTHCEIPQRASDITWRSRPHTSGNG